MQNSILFPYFFQTIFRIFSGLKLSKKRQKMDFNLQHLKRLQKRENWLKIERLSNLDNIPYLFQSKTSFFILYPGLKN